MSVSRTVPRKAAEHIFLRRLSGQRIFLSCTIGVSPADPMVSPNTPNGRARLSWDRTRSTGRENKEIGNASFSYTCSHTAKRTSNRRHCLRPGSGAGASGADLAEQRIPAVVPGQERRGAGVLQPNQPGRARRRLVSAAAGQHGGAGNLPDPVL